MENQKHLVAVYGTLMEGEANHRWAERAKAKKIGEGLVHGRIYNTGCYPIIELDDEQYVRVEVVEVDDAGLQVLDVLEGYPRLYSREKVRVFMNWCDRCSSITNGELILDALIYVPTDPERWSVKRAIELDKDGVADWRERKWQHRDSL